jgi:ferredoxin
MWRVTVSDACVGSGLCIGVAPQHFRLDAGERSHPTGSLLPPEESILDAAAFCPMEAIQVRDSVTGADPTESRAAHRHPDPAS